MTALGLLIQSLAKNFMLFLVNYMDLIPKIQYPVITANGTNLLLSISIDTPNFSTQR